MGEVKICEENESLEDFFPEPVLIYVFPEHG